MIVSLVADRRTPGVAGVAHDLAVALRHRLNAPSIALYVDRMATRSLGTGRAFDLEFLPLPGAMRAALGALRPEQHAVLAFLGTVTKPAFTAFALSAKVLVVTDGQVASLRAAQRTFKLCRDVGYPPRRLSALVLADDPASTAVDTVRAALKGVSYFVIPNATPDPEARRAAVTDLASRVARGLS